MDAPDKTPEQSINGNTALEEPGTCKIPGCRCIHEQGLVAVKNADGSTSQMSKEQAKAQLESLKQLQDQLGGVDA